MTTLSILALPPPPTPYEYALISNASYSDSLIENLASDQSGSILQDRGWWVGEVFTAAENDGYQGSLWVHTRNKQIVIAHRGSQNPDSWITDFSTIRNLKPGNFVEQSIKLLKHEIVKELYQRGYRLSITGHSLGGFLAQVTVYYSLQVNSPETYFPE